MCLGYCAVTMAFAIGICAIIAIICFTHSHGLLSDIDVYEIYLGLVINTFYDMLKECLMINLSLHECS
jgi:hypothetical protein